MTSSGAALLSHRISRSRRDGPLAGGAPWDRPRRASTALTNATKNRAITAEKPIETSIIGTPFVAT